MNLTSKHLHLRPVKIDDALSIHLYAGDEETTRYMLWGPNTYSQTLKYVEDSITLNNMVPKKIYRFAIVLKYSDDLIGMIDLTLKSSRVAEIGYILNRSHWNKGYTTEAMKIIINYAFKDLHLDKVFATCDKQNIASYRVMEKAGLHFVGTFTKYNPKLDKDLEGLLYELDKSAS